MARTTRRVARRVAYGLQRIAQWVVPPGLQRLAEAACGPMLDERGLSQAERRVLSANASLCDAYLGRRCFIVGNGPSLNQQDLHPLGREVTIVMNHFFEHPILDEWQPTFYCVADPPHYYTQREICLMKSGISRVSPQRFFIPLSMMEMVREHELFPWSKTSFVAPSGGLKAWQHGRQLWDLTHRLPGVRTTAHLCLMVAIFVGCSPIYLIGLDHDWLAHRSPQRHFYPSSAEDIGGPEDLAMYPYRQMVEGTLKTWKTYQALHEAADQRGIEIFNATAGGFLDVFPRVDYESLFS